MGVCAKGYQKRDEVPLAGAVLQAEVAGKVVGDEVGLAALHGRAHGTHDLRAGVGVLGAHVLGEGDVGEAHLVAVRTGEALRLLGGQHLATVVQLEVGAREDALHRVVRLVAGAGRALLVAVGAQVVVVADQALEAPAPEVALQARITADSCGVGCGRERAVVSQCEAKECRAARREMVKSLLIASSSAKRHVKTTTTTGLKIDSLQVCL